jgi:hypothetical protein
LEGSKVPQRAVVARGWESYLASAINNQVGRVSSGSLSIAGMLVWILSEFFCLFFRLLLSLRVGTSF